MSMIINPYWFATAGGGGLDPGSFLAGLDWFLLADNISGNDNDPVVDWFDVSGANKHYGQNTSTNQPTLKKNIYNGHASVEFATNDKLLPDPNPRADTAQNTLIVVCTPSSTSNSYIFGGNGGDGNPSFISGFGGKAFEYFNTNSERATFAASASGLHVLTITRTDSTGNVVGYFDTTQVFSIPVVADNWANRAINELGANANAAGDDFYNGNAPCWIHFNQNHEGASGLADLIDEIISYYAIA